METLNYRITNERLYQKPIRVQYEEGDGVVEDEAARWSSEGDWVLLDGRLGIVRLWGEGDWELEYRWETEPLRKDHVWKHETWALNITFRNTSPPRGYGLMGGHAVLFVPAESADEVASIARQDRAGIVEEHGRFDFTCSLDGWQTSRQIDLGHLLSFA